MKKVISHDCLLGFWLKQLGRMKLTLTEMRTTAGKAGLGKRSGAWTS
jgi:hypothetical protein